VSGLTRRQRLSLRRWIARGGQEEGGLQLGWRFVDVVVLSLLIELDDALMSPLTVAFAALIVASAFWARADQILQTTLLSLSGYLALVLFIFTPTGSLITRTGIFITWSAWSCSA